MTSRIFLKRSNSPNKIPLASDLTFGELALNYIDGRLFCKLNDNSIFELSSDTIKINRSANANNIALADTNIFIGKDINIGITTGIKNLGIGVAALKLNQSGNNDIAIGNNALLNTIGSNVLGIGVNAGQGNTTGSNNLYIGNNSGSNNTIGNSNISIGHNVTFANNNNINSIVIGNDAIGTGNNSITIGNANYLNVKLFGRLNLQGNITTSTVGSNNVTSNFPCGQIICSTSTCTVTNSYCATNTLVFCQAVNSPNNRYISSVIASNGSFLITWNGNVTNVRVNYILIGTN